MTGFNFSPLQRAMVSMVGAVLLATTFVGAAVSPAHVSSAATQTL